MICKQSVCLALDLQILGVGALDAPALLYDQERCSTSSAHTRWILDLDRIKSGSRFQSEL